VEKAGGIVTWWGRNKNHAVRTYSDLCQREFASKGECEHGEVLYLLQEAKIIKDLKYQIPFQLCLKPNIKITIDFSYKMNGETRYDEVKGKMEREFRVKLAWLLKEHPDINIDLIKPMYIRSNTKNNVVNKPKRVKKVLVTQILEHMR